MLTVKEIKYGNESTFKFIVSNTNKIDYEQTIHFKSVIKEYSGYNFMYIYTPSMEVISSVFEFLNFQMRDYAINSRIKALQALKLLYTFEKVIDTDFTKFTAQDVMSFRAFLRVSVKPCTHTNANLYLV
ncbi:hypothetical protein [Vallitalea sp.]|jgi:hypothetical protein|uniref:hypothetical protein n=1 Tax=Vallitalea sp. TaxID=1882829 RepID=UPI0026011702|nr:hypothetical protein [Vallitalea sp.]MCT4686200.1 hypothetical protein [Vallitalea sp.]